MNLLRALATVGVITGGSRILGFARDILIAKYLGAGPVTDAFVVAFRFPNLFRRMFAEGAFNAAFVPLFAKRVEGEGPAAARDFAEQALAVLATALIVLTAAAILAMPVLMIVLAPGFTDEPETFARAVLYTQIAFPYLLFVSLTALFAGILNSLRRFGAAAATQLILNLVLIAAMLIVAAVWQAPEAGDFGLALVVGVAIAGVLQLLMLIVPAARAGYALRLRRPRLTPAVRRLIKLGVPGVVAGGFTQVNIIIATMIASMQTGAVSWLYYADRIYQLPLGLVGVAMGVVLLPELSRRLRAGDEGGAGWTQNRALELSALLILPAATALAVIPEMIVRVLFERGAFTAGDTDQTALALSIYALGLPAFVLNKVFSAAFFAREDTVTPMRFALVAMLTDTALALTLFFTIGFAGIPIAGASAAWLNATLLGITLWRRGQIAPDRRLVRALGAIAACCVIMGAGLHAAGLWLAPMIAAGGFAAIGALAAVVAGGALVYFISGVALGAARLSDLRAALTRR